MHIGERYAGMILGTAVGDALGVPWEGVSKGVVTRWGPNPWRHQFIFGKGMVSDDTDHTVFVCQCLISSSNDIEKFERSLA